MNIKALAGKIGMNYEEVLEDFCGDVTLINEKVNSFLSECGFDEIKEAFDQKDEEAVKKASHHLKKKAEKIGLSGLVKASSLLEEAKSGRQMAAYENLEREFLQVKAALTPAETEA